MPEIDQGVRKLILLRTTVAGLGERTTPPWWRTQFLTDVGLRTMGRVFMRTAIRAAIESTTIVARADHDRRIGIGGRYHLFRFPTILEHRLIGPMLDDSVCEEITAILKRPQTDRLKALAQPASPRKVVAAEGPVRLGPPERLLDPSALEEMAAHYYLSVETGRRVFPYFEAKVH